MTPMSDVMVLLLTFFMLTANFVKEEPIKVVTPGSVSDIQIPERNLLTVFVEPTGKVFMTMDSPDNLTKLINEMERNGSLPGVTALKRKRLPTRPRSELRWMPWKDGWTWRVKPKELTF